ncbi:MAG: AI-2E family transporter [Methanospirillum sp.]
MSPPAPLPPWTIWVIVLAIFAAAALVFWPLIGVSVLAASLAVVLFPLQRRLTRRMRPFFAALLLTVVVGATLVLAIAVTIAVILQNIGFIEELVGTILAAATVPAANPFAGVLPIDLAQVTDAIRSEIGSFSTSLQGMVGELPMVSLEIIVFFLVLHLTLEEGEETGLRLLHALPDQMLRPVTRLWAMAVDVMYSIFVVHFATAFVTFLVALPFFWILGYGHILFFAVLSGVFQLVPFLGQTVILLVLGGYALAIGDVRGLLLVLFVGYPFVAAIPDLVMRPLLMGARTGIHPAVMFIGFFGGITLLGFVGIVLGPLLLALAVGAYGIIVEELELRRQAALPAEPRPSALEGAAEAAEVETAS